MTFRKQLAAALAALILSLGVLAAPMEVSGIKLDDPIDVSGTKLQLNGAGTRYKAVFKVYVAALYSGKKVSTPEELYATPGPKRMSITVVREVESNELGKSFTTAFTDNTPKAEMSKLIPGLIRMGQLFAAQKKLIAGENFTIDWIPGTGTIISVKGVPQGEPFKEPEFFIAMMRIWFGPNPADFRLKDQLLGKPA